MLLARRLIQVDLIAKALTGLFRRLKDGWPHRLAPDAVPWDGFLRGALMSEAIIAVSLS